MKSKWAVIVLLCTLATQAQAYEFATGKVFLRGVVGPIVNVVRFTSVDNGNSPGAGLVLGAEAEYVIDKPWSLTAGFRPIFSPGFVEFQLGLGAKYRWSDLGVPFILYVAAELTPSVLMPTTADADHFNLGIRPSVGADYFLMRDLVLGIQIAAEPSVLLNSSMRSFEASIEFLVGLMYRI